MIIFILGQYNSHHFVSSRLINIKLPSQLLLICLLNRNQVHWTWLLLYCFSVWVARVKSMVNYHWLKEIGCLAPLMDYLTLLFDRFWLLTLIMFFFYYFNPFLMSSWERVIQSVYNWNLSLSFLCLHERFSLFVIINHQHQINPSAANFLIQWLTFTLAIINCYLKASKGKILIVLNILYGQQTFNFNC